MENYIIENCKECHQPLRIPADIGGMLMRCPKCGYEFHTDFKLAPELREDAAPREPARKKPARKPPSTFKTIV